MIGGLVGAGHFTPSLRIDSDECAPPAATGAATVRSGSRPCEHATGARLCVQHRPGRGQVGEPDRARDLENSTCTQSKANRLLDFV